MKIILMLVYFQLYPPSKIHSTNIQYVHGFNTMAECLNSVSTTEYSFMKDPNRTIVSIKCTERGTL